MKKNYSLIFLIFFLFIFFLVLVKTAWITDDAFLTMRTVDNFINGYGLRWNILERVQIYTHPLWMFLLSATYMLLRNPMRTFYVQTILVSLVALYVLGISFANTSRKIVFAFLLLLLSKAFVDYSTAGLENPLTHLLTLLFFLFFFRKDENFSPKDIFLLFFVASLVVFNRMDTFLILFPALLYVIFRNHTWKSILYATLGFSPFFFWEIFSVIYYGFPFPNTAYAKLGTGIAKSLILQQGGRYFYDSLLRDPITLVVIFTAIVAALLGRDLKNKLLAFGILLYLGYVLEIGGDYMSGRFFSAAMFLSVVILTRISEIFSFSTSSFRYLTLFLLAFFLRFYVLSVYHPFEYRENIIHDDRALSTSTTLANTKFGALLPDNRWVKNGLRMKSKGVRVTVQDTAGMFAFYAGPQVHIVDRFGLGDPLLARLPAANQNEVLIGHFYRNVPKGYWRFPNSFGNEIENDDLRKYYEKLSVLVHSEKLFSKERFVIIWRMNTGYYEYLLQNYLVSLDSEQ